MATRSSRIGIRRDRRSRRSLARQAYLDGELCGVRPDGSGSTCYDNPSTIRSGGRRPLRRCRASAGRARISPAPPSSRYGSRRRVMLWWRQKFSDGRRRQGGSRIRTRGPPCQRSCSLGEGECVKDANAHVAKALSVSGDRGFESYSLQRGVPCEPDFSDRVVRQE
jgi:hypothetical protein